HYRVMVVEEGVFEPRPILGPVALYELADRYADIITLDEALAIMVEAGFDVQIDDPFLSHIFGDPAIASDRDRVKKADLYVESINHALRGIPVERIRFHTCYGINEGPRVHEPQLGDVIEHVLRVNAGA